MIMGYCSDKVIPVKSSLFRGIKVCAVFNDLTWRHADIPYDTQKKKPLRALKDHFNLDLSFSKRLQRRPRKRAKFTYHCAPSALPRFRLARTRICRYTRVV